MGLRVDFDEGCGTVAPQHHTPCMVTRVLNALTVSDYSVAILFLYDFAQSASESEHCFLQRDLVVKVCLLKLEVHEFLHEADDLAELEEGGPLGGEEAYLLLRLLLRVLVFFRKICLKIQLNLGEEFSRDAFFDTVDRKPPVAALTCLFEHQRTQVKLHKPQTGVLTIALLAHFDLERAQLDLLIVENHLEVEKRVLEAALPDLRS